jgi:hypothetical protein
MGRGDALRTLGRVTARRPWRTGSSRFWSPRVASVATWEVSVFDEETEKLIEEVKVLLSDAELSRG